LKRKTAREFDRKNVFTITSSSSSSPQREELLRKILGGIITTERRTIKKNFRGIYNKLNFIKQNYTEKRRKTERKKEFPIRSSSGIDHREKKFFF